MPTHRAPLVAAAASVLARQGQCFLAIHYLSIEHGRAHESEHAADGWATEPEIAEITPAERQPAKAILAREAFDSTPERWARRGEERLQLLLGHVHQDRVHRSAPARPGQLVEPTIARLREADSALG